MANYTDEQVKKALECCRGKGCKECPFRCPYGNASCIRNLMGAILDLINRQEADLNNIGIALEVTRDNLGDRLRELQQAEVKIDELETLAERLGDDVDRKLKYIYELEEQLKTAKSEARKEFAEKVIDLIYEADDVNPINEWQVRNLVEEMEGESE